MAAKTYTLLVTVIGDELPSIKQLEGAVQRVLEEGMPAGGSLGADLRSASCAYVDAFDGDRLHGLQDHMTRVRRAHEETVREALRR